MKDRCYNVKNKWYKGYGARGIKVCQRWHEFYNFYLDMGKRPVKNLTLERVNNNGDYSPSNCIWATMVQQNRNTRRNINITFQGKTQCIAAWADELKMNRVTLHQRIRGLGWPVKRALTEGVQCRRSKKVM